jgi:hypothetical protein
MVGMVVLRERGGVRPGVNQVVRRGRVAGVHRDVRMGPLCQPDVRRPVRSVVRQLRDAGSHMFERHVDSMVAVRERRRVRARSDPGLRHGRSTDLHERMPVGWMRGSVVRRSRGPALRELRDSDPDLQQRGLVRLVGLR